MSTGPNQPPARKTRIVSTLGPASFKRTRELMEAAVGKLCPPVRHSATICNATPNSSNGDLTGKKGVNVFRLNFSHVTDPEPQLGDVIRDIRKNSRELGLPIAILGDMGGPKIRCNGFKNEANAIDLKQGDKVKIMYSEEDGTDGVITTSVEPVCRQLEVGHRLLLDDGQLNIKILEKPSKYELIGEVQNSWKLKSRKGINVPDIMLDIPAVTDKDKKDVAFAWKYRLEYIAESFVQSKRDVEMMLETFEDIRKKEVGDAVTWNALDESDQGYVKVDPKTWRPYIICKIEKPQALDNIDGILEKADGIMVARGDLGVECSYETVPISQKMLIQKTNAVEKPVITATQMLESMIGAPVPTRAEVSDVANAIFDGTDAVMTSAETASGQYPLETVRTMAQICAAADKEVALHHVAAPPPRDKLKDKEQKEGWSVPVGWGHSMVDAALAAADYADAKAILLLTNSGHMATLIAKRRPEIRVIAITGVRNVYRRMNLLRGIEPVFSSHLRDIRAGKAQKNAAGTAELGSIIDAVRADVGDRIPKDSTVVVCSGSLPDMPNITNSVRIAKF